jgi:carbon storage regulator
MLIVRRRAGQAVLIGDQVEIHVLEIAPGRVKLGVVAPREIPVLRAEVKLTRETNLAAAQTVPAEKLAELARRLRKEGPAPGAAALGPAGEPSEQP